MGIKHRNTILIWTCYTGCFSNRYPITKHSCGKTGGPKKIWLVYTYRESLQVFFSPRTPRFYQQWPILQTITKNAFFSPWWFYIWRKVKGQWLVLWTFVLSHLKELPRLHKSHIGTIGLSLVGRPQIFEQSNKNAGNCDPAMCHF